MAEGSSPETSSELSARIARLELGLTVARRRLRNDVAHGEYGDRAYLPRHSERIGSLERSLRLARTKQSLPGHCAGSVTDLTVRAIHDQ